MTGSRFKLVGGWDFFPVPVVSGNMMGFPVCIDPESGSSSSQSLSFKISWKICIHVLDLWSNQKRIYLSLLSDWTSLE